MTIISVVKFRSFGVNPVMHKSMMPLNIPEYSCTLHRFINGSEIFMF